MGIRQIHFHWAIMETLGLFSNKKKTHIFYFILFVFLLFFGPLPWHIYFKRITIFLIPYRKIIPDVFKTKQTNLKPLIYNKRRKQGWYFHKPKGTVERFSAMMNLKMKHKYSKHMKSLLRSEQFCVQNSFIFYLSDWYYKIDSAFKSKIHPFKRQSHSALKRKRKIA